MSALLWHSAVALTGLALLGWVWQWRTRNGGYADVVWVFGLGGTGLYYLLSGEGVVWIRVMASALLFLWSLRLGLHILVRVAGEAEDGRYRAMRERLGGGIQLFHFFFFLFQGLLAWLFALPHWVIASRGAGQYPALAVAGLVIGVGAIVGEALADRQLSRWRQRPENRGRTCRAGLWRYSRHPNYFFEWLHWFAWPLLAWGAPLAAWTWLAPVIMFVFLRYLTGVPYTEKQALKSRGEDYRHYQRTTSPFLPWRPRHAD